MDFSGIHFLELTAYITVSEESGDSNTCLERRCLSKKAHGLFSGMLLLGTSRIFYDFSAVTDSERVTEWSVGTATRVKKRGVCLKNHMNGSSECFSKINRLCVNCRMLTSSVSDSVKTATRISKRRYL